MSISEKADADALNYRGSIMSDEYTKAIETSKTKLYIAMRFLGLALGSLTLEENNKFSSCATDGFKFYYNKDYIEISKGIALNRAYLHSVLHCLYRHIIMRNSRDKLLWDISCDIATEHIIDSIMNKYVQRHQSHERATVYALLRAKKSSFTAQSVYTVLSSQQFDEQTLMSISQEFYIDDHSLWCDENTPKQKIESLMQKWGKIGEHTDSEAQTFARESAESAEELIDVLNLANRDDKSYSELLKKFSIRQEILKPDEDSINTSFYMYGFSLYGNLALIEPQETKEEKKIRTFAIVIDTSMSCSEEVIRSFLTETYEILVSDELAPNANVRIIQCDDEVRSDMVLRSTADIKRLSETFTVKGRGGTDFRPAFQYINDLIDKGELKGLRGVFLFTDGDGIFPKKRPKYDTAFVFPNEEYPEEKIPSWGIRCVMK